MALADRSTIAAGTSGFTLMLRAAEGVARATAKLVARLGPGKRRIAVACGPGNNGGDGLAAAQWLAERGFDVTLGLMGSAQALRGDAAEAARHFRGGIASLQALDFAGADAIIDALFGAGLARDLDGEAAATVERMNASGKPILAVDVPSGLDGNTGKVRGIAVRAAATVTFFRLKPGHVLLPGRALCGATEVVDIGIAPEVLEAIAPRCFLNAPGLWRGAFRQPESAGHKYSRGHALTVSGGPNHTGAVRMAARAALRAGAGLVTVASPPEALAAHAAHLTAIMLTPFEGASGLAEILADPRKNAVVLGPALGVGAATRVLVEAALAAPAAPGRGFVLDADALTSFAGDLASLTRLVAAAPGPVALTPHDGEFARLFDGEPDIAEAPSKLERARRAARRLGAYMVLKGADTVVAAPDGRASIGYDLPPWLATAGSGDVLTGLIGGLLAQEMPAFEAASCGVWLHGAAARAFGPGLIAEDLPEALHGVVARLSEAS
jgi:hydroxyethylthiazole kinase-like uncharacterized protein yjeF